jgi:hypothetical protein
MQDSPPTNSNIFRTVARLLTFRLTQKEFLELGGMHLVFGLVCAWLVGMGRYWDDPGAQPWSRLGNLCFRSFVVPLAADLAVEAAELVLS